MVVLVVGLHDLHLRWHAWEHGPGPPTPLLTTAPSGVMKMGTGGTLGAPMVSGRQRGCRPA